jgi:hypothetical protein
MTVRRLVWRGLDEPRMEIAYVEPDWEGRRARGAQIGPDYELRYELDGHLLHVEVVGTGERRVELGDADCFDLASSPLFNSLPVLRDGLLETGPARDYVMRWVDVPSLEVFRAEQRYEPRGDGVIRFSSGTFTADIEFDEDAFVVRYPGLAERVYA